MDKVLVELYIPAIGETIEAFVPLQAKGYEVLTLLGRAVSELSNGRFLATDQSTLCRREDGMILNINLSVYELDIRNGSRLMLI